MQIRIKATKIKLTPEMKDYVQKKMDMLDKYLGNFPVIYAEFEVELTTKHHQKGEIFRAEVNMNLAGHFLRVEKTEKDLYKAIDKVKDHLKDMIVEHKNRRRGE